MKVCSNDGCRKEVWRGIYCEDCWKKQWPRDYEIVKKAEFTTETDDDKEIIRV